MIQDKIYAYFDGNDGLRVLFVFDQMLQIESELKGCTWREGYHYEIFDGRWFTTKYKIEHDWVDQKVVLLFPNMIEPSGDTSKDFFPLFGEMTANMVFHNESYQAFMQLRGIPATREYATFVSLHVAELQLSKVEKVLSAYYKPGLLSLDVLQRGLLSSWLGQERLLSWGDILIRAVVVLGVETTKKRESLARSLQNNPDILSALSSHLESVFGRPLNLNSEDRIKEPVESFKYNAITQHLVPVSADDYKYYKITGALALQSLNNFIQTSLQHPLKDRFYAAVHSLGSAILEDNIIKWYGPDAEYALITESLCYPILEALVPRITTNPESCNERLSSISLKLSPESLAQVAIRFLNQTSQYYARRKSFGSFKLNNRMEFIYRYKSEFCMMDMAYRKAILEFRKVSSACPIYESLASFKTSFDFDYANAVNEFNLEWMKCVREEGCRLNDIEGILHQQDFYSTHIGSSATKVAIIISDALRYEVAVQLMQEFSEKKHTATLDAALAMLPTETKYCKDAMLPHDDLRLQIDTMFVNGGIVVDTKDRDAQLKKYHPDGLCILFSEIKKRTVMENRENLRRSVVYIYHDTIDSISHDHPEKTPQACEDSVDELKDFIAQLHASYNFTNVILTADHGFLYNDLRFDDTKKHKVPEESIELKTRYYLTENAAPAASGSIGITKLSLEKVSGMDHPDGVFVAVPDGANRFFAPGGGYEFAHGGASLQELVIPVLFSSLKRVQTKQKVDMNLMETKLDIVSSRLSFRIIQLNPVSVDRQERKISCGLYQGENLVSNEKIFTLSSTNDVDYNSRIYRIDLSLKKPVTDPVLELRIYDVDDRINPLIKMPANNRTLIEQDF